MHTYIKTHIHTKTYTHIHITHAYKYTHTKMHTQRKKLRIKNFKYITKALI